MAVGMCCSKYKICLPRSILILLFIVALICSIYNYNSICESIMGIILFLMVKDINLKDRTVYYFFRKSSTIIYFMHMIFFFLYSLFIGFEEAKGIDGFLISLISCIIFSIFIYIIQKKYNFRLIKEAFG